MDSGWLLLPVLVAFFWGSAKLIELQVRYDWRGKWKQCWQCDHCSHVDYYAIVRPSVCESCGTNHAFRKITARAEFWGGYEIKEQKP